MIDVLFLQLLQGDAGFPQDFVLPRQQLRAKIIALALVHERLFFGGSVVFQLFQGQPYLTRRWERVLPRPPYIAVSCDRQYRGFRKKTASPKDLTGKWDGGSGLARPNGWLTVKVDGYRSKTGT